MPVYNYTPFDDPLGTQGTFATGINASGQIIGYYFDSGLNRHGFLFSGGTYTTLDDPLATNGTRASGINAIGQIVGEYTNNSGVHGFLFTDSLSAPIDDPLGTQGTFATGINASGQIIGYYVDSGLKQHGFLEVTSPNPPPPAGTTADMILRHGADGFYEIY